MAIINLYQGQVTAGKTDGTLVSTNGSMSAPVEVILDPLLDEEKIIPLAIRTVPGYKTTSTTTISTNNDTGGHWKLSWAIGASFTDSISTDAEITAVNTLFYAKAGASSGETITEDTDVSLQVKAKVVTDETTIMNDN